MKHSYNIFQDWNANKGNSKGKIVMVLYRIAHLATFNRLFFLILIPYLILYRLLVEWILCVELPYKVIIGQNLKLYHGQALVINRGVVIGSNCTIRHCTTIGNRINADGTFSNCPVIGNNVDIGTNSCIIGDVKVGNNVSIGAGSIVVKNIPDNSVAVGNPARVIKSLI